MNITPQVFDYTGSIIAKAHVEVSGVQFAFGPTNIDIPGYDVFGLEHGFARAKREDDNRREPSYYLILEHVREWTLHRVMEAGANGILIGSETVKVPKEAA